MISPLVGESFSWAAVCLHVLRAGLLFGTVFLRMVLKWTAGRRGQFVSSPVQYQQYLLWGKIQVGLLASYYKRMRFLKLRLPKLHSKSPACLMGVCIILGFMGQGELMWIQSSLTTTKNLWQNQVLMKCWTLLVEMQNGTASLEKSLAAS